MESIRGSDTSDELTLQVPGRVNIAFRLNVGLKSSVRSHFLMLVPVEGLKSVLEAAFPL